MRCSVIMCKNCELLLASFQTYRLYERICTVRSYATRERTMEYNKDMHMIYKLKEIKNQSFSRHKEHFVSTKVQAMPNRHHPEE